MLTTTEVAKRLSVATNTVSTWAQKGLLPGILLPGGQWRFRAEDIEELMKPNNLKETK